MGRYIYGGVDYGELKLPVTVFVENSLDQDVTVQIKGNRSKSTSGAISVGSSFTVSAGGNDGRTLTPSTSGWLPYIYVEVSCSTAPSSGSLTIYLVKSEDTQPKLVDSLEIRDTNTHTPDTDPDKVFILGW